MPTAEKKPSWKEKLDRDEGFPKVVPTGPSMTLRWGERTMVILAPREVDEIMKRIPSGKLITVNEIRAVLALRHGATIGCPMTTEIVAWIAANAAEEGAERRADHEGTPYWGMLKTGGFLNDKYPGGAAGQKAKLENGDIGSMSMASVTRSLITRRLWPSLRWKTDGGHRNRSIELGPGCGPGEYIGLSARPAGEAGYFLPMACPALR